MSGLRITGLGVRLAGRHIVANLDVQAARGQVTALIGPNGAGKSTVLRAILGLTPCVGTICWDGQPLPAAAHERSQHCAWVPQHSRLDAALRVREVVAAGCWRGLPARSTIDAALAAVAADDLSERWFPTLSGGEQARVLLARAIAGGAGLLLVDEPGAHLDLAHRLALYALLRQQAATGRAVICVLHELGDVARVADRCLLLNGGRLVREGTPGEVVCDDLLRASFGLAMRPDTAPGFELAQASA